MSPKLSKTYFESFSVMILHTGIMLGVIVQLLSSKFMHKHSGIPIELNLYYLHRLSGVFVFIMVILFISVKAYRATLWDLYPWHRDGFHKILVDIKLLLTGRIPVRRGIGLARFIQGLGILLVLAMSCLGIGWWIIGTYNFDTLVNASTLIHWHKNISTLVWIYVIGHTAMTFLHWIWPKKRLIELP